MRLLYSFKLIVVTAILVLSAVTASAQTGQLRGHVIFKQADGTSSKPADVVIDVYRTDLSGVYHTKTDKRGEFVFAGLPFIGNYIIAASLPNAMPTFQDKVKVGRDIDFEIVLNPGDGHKLTLDDIKKMQAAGGGDAAGPAISESAAEKAKLEDIKKKNEEITAANKKAENINAVVGDSFKAGNTALQAAGEAAKANKHDEAIKLYGDAVQQYDIGLAADSEQAALLTNKAAALKAAAGK